MAVKVEEQSLAKVRIYSRYYTRDVRSELSHLV